MISGTLVFLKVARNRAQSDSTNRKFVLARRPRGEPDDSTFRLETEDLVTPGKGQMLLRNEFLSLDPYMRGRMSDAPSYAAPVAIGAKVLSAREIKIGMDGKGHGGTTSASNASGFSTSVSAARAGIGRYPNLCSRRRPHLSLDPKTPYQAHFNPPMPDAVAP